VDQRQNRCRHTDFPLTPSLPADVRETAGEDCRHAIVIQPVKMPRLFSFHRRQQDEADFSSGKERFQLGEQFQKGCIPVLLLQSVAGIHLQGWKSQIYIQLVYSVFAYELRVLSILFLLANRKIPPISVTQYTKSYRIRGVREMVCPESANFFYGEYGEYGGRVRQERT